MNTTVASPETFFCKFHPLDSATNFCPNCDVHYCDICSDESASLRPSRARENHSADCCFVCSGGLEPLQRAQKIPPFWSRLGEIYKYPLNFQAIIALIVVSFMTALVGGSLLLMLLVTVAMALYTFTCLRETAGGHFEAPGLEACFEGSLAPLFYMLVAFVIQGTFVYQVFVKIGFEFGLIAAAFFVLSIPAMTILIAVEESLVPALNPAQLFGVIRATGVSYFVMLLFVLIMTSSVFAIVAFFGGEARSFFGVFLQSLVSNYYSIVIYHIMGYLVYQNQDALGYGGGSVHESADLNRSDKQRAKAKLDVLIKAGDYQNAYKLAHRQLKEPSATLWDWSRAFSLACASSATEKSDTRAAKFFFEYAAKLESEGELEALADAYSEIKKRQPGFVIESLAQRLLVAECLFESGQYSHVVNLLHKFHQQSEDAKLTTSALKLISESLASVKGHEKLAKQYASLYQLQLKANPA